jgi:hypothetical protein
LKKGIIILLVAILCKSCAPTKKVILDPKITGVFKINTQLNKENYTARKTFYGQLDENEYGVIINKIEKSLGIKINKNQNLLINFKQNGKNCILAGINSFRICTILSKEEEISERFTKPYSTQNLLVYAKNSYFVEFISDRKKWIKDAGFLNDELFKLKETCEAFFLIKPTGEFCMYYGGDYYSFVKNRLEAKDWSDKKRY